MTERTVKPMDELRGLWRGKHDDVDSSEWVSGYLVKMWEKFCLQDPQCENRVTEVAPATLGECTGLRDKNGTPIFEGDILHFVNTYCNANTEWLCAVEFHDGDFICRYLEEDGHLGEYIHFGSWNCPKVVWDVCGNIHDNSELLKGGEDDGTLKRQNNA